MSSDKSPLGAQTVLDALRANGMHADLRAKSAVAWNDLMNGLPYQPVGYCAAMIDYQISYWNGNARPTLDASVVLSHDSRPCCIWPLSITKGADGALTIGSNGGAVLPPLFVESLARKSVKSLSNSCFSTLQSLCNQLGQTHIECDEAFVDRLGMSDWHDRLMSNGAVVELKHDLFVDLSKAMADIKGEFRKSYKSLVTAGAKLWDVQVVITADPQQWEEFRLLHLAVAGRATRSEDSWRIQHDAVSAGEAFLVRLRDKDGLMVGAGLFHVTRDEGLYAVGAYNRSLFDKPLGHVVQFFAIEEMKRRGLRWYKLGSRAYSGEVPFPTNKEIAISDFKQGFSTHLLPRYVLRHGLVKRGTAPPAVYE